MAKVNIKGPIISSDEKWIYNWFGMDATCARDVEKVINSVQQGEQLEVIINSNGGYVDEGSEIYTLLKDYNGEVVIKIVGMAASAASVIAMGGDKVKISPTGRIMIHNAAGGVCGDYRQMEHGAEVLKDCNEAIANAYALKTGMSKEELLDLMNKETFMNAQKAKQLGFVDEIMFDNSNRLVNDLNSGMLPKDVIEKIRNMKEEEFKKENNKDEEKEINSLKEKLVLKNKSVTSFLLCQKEGML
ncbi:head maturation protease, ClpP-related [Clostridium perfringens]|uniref:head maturation protease, ClpP-related n=1 Tax=Clostridium perfringens TaxID=1502 RepID=UPI002909636F|nr:head maturation protease, ClpP-related [Clostridium perfringens]MDU3664006.1 Clp protease ClpP [Clostridium perfringens]MEA5268959.1 Clp protease ClpP [Clostridium perfringens]MEA5271585.1 Clp protease ClpP [Clostridium perfringens]MEA5342119.1 Clp protease ClpP [Clostridium perfringens]MEA5380649.1 Clp protease ClpP [Clostridium perfringens]